MTDSQLMGARDAHRNYASSMAALSLDPPARSTTRIWIEDREQLQRISCAEHAVPSRHVARGLSSGVYAIDEVWFREGMFELVIALRRPATDGEVDQLGDRARVTLPVPRGA